MTRPPSLQQSEAANSHLPLNPLPGSSLQPPQAWRGKGQQAVRDQGNPEQRGEEPGRVEKWGLKRQTIEDPPPCRYSVPLSLPTRLCSTVATCGDGSAAAKKGPAFQERVSVHFGRLSFRLHSSGNCLSKETLVPGTWETFSS